MATAAPATAFNVIAQALMDVYDDEIIKTIYRDYCDMVTNAQWAADHGNPDLLKQIPTPAQYAEYERNQAKRTPAGWFIYWED